MGSVEWCVDATTSRPLRVVSHLPIAGIGGSMLLVGLFVVVSVVTTPVIPSVGTVLFVALLVLVGGPFSLLYLLPMLTDPEQRPSRAEFDGAEGSPFTARSTGGAVIAGAVGIVGLLAAGIPFGVVYGLVVVLVFSPLAVAVFTTECTLDDAGLTVNRTAVPIERVTGYRSVRLGESVVFWIAYAPRSGLLLPRLVTLPASAAAPVRARLETGLDATPADDPPDPVVQAVVIGMGLSFLAVAGVAATAIDEAGMALYVVAILGGVGLVLCVAGWRGL